MITSHSVGSITWLDVLSPDQENIRTLLETCGLTPELLTDLRTPVPRSDAVSTGDAIKLTLDFPVVKRTDVVHGHELKLIVTKTHFISVRYEDMEAIDRFRKEVEVIAALKTPGKRATAAHLSFTLLDELYKSLNTKLDYLESRLGSIEAEIFNHREKEMVTEISNVSRRLINFRQALEAHEHVLTKSETHYETLYGKAARHELHEIHTSYEHLKMRVETLVSTLKSLRDTNMALLSTKQNEIMKTLTIMAFITFPLTLFTSMFGMNTQTIPLVGYKNDFWIIVGIMLLVSLGFFAFFKYKRWI